MKRLAFLFLIFSVPLIRAQAPCPVTTGNIFASTTIANCFTLTNTFAQGVNLGNITIANLPSAALNAGTIISVRDGSTSTDCTVGGGTNNNLCLAGGGVWAVVSGSGGNNGQENFTLNGTANQIVGPGTVTLGSTASMSIASPFIFPGKATTAASIAGSAGFNIPPGTAPTSPVAGDIWLLSGVMQYSTGSQTNSFVNSVSLTLPPEFAVTGSPVTSTGTLAVSKNTQTANTFWRGPTTGNPAAPTFGSIVAADLPVANAQNVAGPLSCPDSSGSSTAYVCATNPSFTPTYPVCIYFTTTTTNTAASTLNVNSTSAIAIEHKSGSAVASGDLPLGVTLFLCLDNTSHWRAQF